MSDSASSAPKRRRVSTSGRGEVIYNTPSSSNLDADQRTLLDHPVASSTDLTHKAPGDPALLHLLDGYYIKRDSINPRNTSGGFCDLFTGNHPVLGKVALKRPRITEDGCTARQLRNFVSEAHIWKQLRHPNILQFVGLIEAPSHVWLVSIFAGNGTLREYIRDHPEADRYGLVLQFTSGLAYLHSRDVVHGDLKSSNLLISDNLSLLIGDFGLSKLKGWATSASKKGVGSLHWMAPELLFEDDPTKTFESDVYAYGITISEILRGELPFSKYTNPVALFRAVSKNERPPTTPLESPQGKSYATLWDVARDCWGPDPSKRPSMIDICHRFSLDYERTIGGKLSSGAIRAEGKTQVHDLTGPATFHLEATPLIQDMSSNLLPANAAGLTSDASDSRLLRLLGNAEYGDIGHLKDDGLCLEGTRVEVLERLDAWADHHSSSRVMLLKGQAGRGKSTIARSVFSRFRSRWGGTASSAIFHFRRDNETLNNRPLRALARQLAWNGDPKVREAILKSVQGHEDVAELRLEEQFNILLVDPLKSLEVNSPRILIVIDALDECSDRSLVSALLRLIREQSTSLPSTIKFLLTSRPEDHIVRPFYSPVEGQHEDLDTIDGAVIDVDIRSYFASRLSAIQRDFGFEAGWVSLKDISELVRRTQGLFQWAHAAMEYVRESPHLNLQTLVRSPNLVLGLPSLYQEIISTAFPRRKDVKDGNRLLPLIQHVIGSLIVAHHTMSPAVLAYLWAHHPDRTPISDPGTEILEGVLGRLGSILVLPSSPDGPIHFMHASVRDFFVDKDTCHDQRFLIDPAAVHTRLADICFRQMKSDLKNTIRVFDDPSKMNSEVLNLVEKNIPSGLRYCCRSWSTHLARVRGGGSTGFNDVQKELEEFCAQRLLHWLEVLSLIGALSEVFDMIRQARNWLEELQILPSENSARTTSLLSDTDDFCRRFFKPMSINAQHINLSFLLQFPGDTTLRSIYPVGQQVPRIIRGPPPRCSDQSRAINTGSKVLCVAVSPDGKIVASGLNNFTIRLWDLDSGELKGEPLVGHTGWVRSVAFAPDGKTLASGSDDKSIRLWNVATGELKGEPLVGHTGWVRSVAFAPDGKTLASGSNDESIRLWNDATGELKGKPLVGHTDSVRSVAFAPNGNTLASGSHDKSIRLWNVATGELKGESLVGHTAWVMSVAFAPDGNTVASGSYDKSIRLWNVATRELKGEPLVGHTGSVRSVAFAPNGNTVASGSQSIRLWNVATGELKGEPLVGHTDSVMSVAFAPDGNTVASGSDDKSIRLWNVATGELKGEPLVGHTNWVWSVAFTPDGNTLISTSWMQTIHWTLGDGPPMPIQAGADQNVTDNKQPGPSTRLGGPASDPDEQGWVFINAKRCFWLPEDFYMEKQLWFRSEWVHFPVEITLFGAILVLHYRNIHIIDVSAFL